MFFCSDVELGKLLGSLDVIPFAFHSISKTSSTNYQIHTTSSGIQVLAFNSSSADSDFTTRFLNREFGLVSSENHQTVDFISSGSEVNSSFYINQAAVECFERLPDDLKQRKQQLIQSPLVVTGQGLGGYSAILFALWLHHEVDKKESNEIWDSKRPICITFGSPLVGDEALQCIISEENPQWKSRFLNVVAKNDRFASFFSSNSGYKPFGTFFFCTESGGHTAFEDQESILAVLDIMASSEHISTSPRNLLKSAENVEIQDYGNLFSAIRRKLLYRGVSESHESNLNSLRAGITRQFREVGILDNISNALIDRMEENQETTIKNKASVYEPTRKLNDMKIKLSYMELYMKSSESNRGYYDCYKNPKNRGEGESKIEIVRHKRVLNQYWESFVKESERKPQLEDAKMRKRWRLSGHNYRRIIEPLDIAEYYAKPGNRNYIETRSDHYKKLEKLLAKDNQDTNASEGKKKAASLTKDSCFWAHVEEALISLTDLKNESSSHNAMDIEQELECFEVYVMRAINECSLSKEIFFKGSSFMEWWAEYNTYKGSSYGSELAQYMNRGSYKLYQ